MVIVVAVDALTSAMALPKRTRFCDGTVEKPVPRRVTTLPTELTLGSTTVMDGPSLVAVIVKDSALVAVAPPTSTLMGPLVAEGGTVATSCVCDAETICACTPLKRTTLLAAVEEKPVPLIVTCVPTGPRRGVN